MDKEAILKSLKGKLIVSCQVLEGEPLYQKEKRMMPLMVRAAKQGGACAIRINSVRDVVAIKKRNKSPDYRHY